MITNLTDPCSLDGEGEDDAVLEDRHFTAPQALLQNIHQLKVQLSQTWDLTQIHQILTSEEEERGKWMFSSCTANPLLLDT